MALASSESVMGSMRTPDNHRRGPDYVNKYFQIGFKIDGFLIKNIYKILFMEFDK
jgi:hypothetical protein